MVDYLQHLQQRLNDEEALVPGWLGDKRAVREFARAIGVQTPQLHFRGSLATLPESLPREFAFKPEFASTSIGVLLLRSVDDDIFENVVTGRELSRTELLEKAAATATRFGKQKHGTFVVEELLRGHSGSAPPKDIRCYAFQGQIGMILMEEHLAGPTKAMYFDGDFRPFSDIHARYGVAEAADGLEEIGDAVTPKNGREVIAVARRVSTAVPSAFCRVDLYDTPKGIFLGEITFYPGTFYYKNRKLMRQIEADRLGRLWDEANERLAGTCHTW